MNLKKIIPELVQGMEKSGFKNNPKEIQTKSIPHIKSGGDLFIIAPEGAGKTNAIVMGVIQQLKAEFEDAPRAIIITSTKQKAYEIETQFETLGRYTNLRTTVVFDKGILQYQKDVIFEGVDVIIGTPKRVYELIKAQGIAFSNMKMIVIDEADSFKQVEYATLYGTTDAAPKSQLIISANKWIEKFDSLSERIMKSPKIVKVFI